jgi:hypothetical protein
VEVLGRRLTGGSALLLGLLLLAGCGGSGGSPARSPRPSASASATPQLSLLGLAGQTSSPLLISAPYQVQGNLGSAGKRHVDAIPVPNTGMAAVTALTSSLGVPGPPISTGTGLGYNLGSTTGYQLTTDAAFDSFNFHPNTPTDEVGTTPTVAMADQFAENFLSAAKVPVGGGVIPLTPLTNVHGSDRTVYFQWSLGGLPVVDILGQPQDIYVDVAANRSNTLQLVGISGAVPYGATGTPVAYPPMQPFQVVTYLNSGVIKPPDYLLSPSGQPFPGAAPTQASLAAISSSALAVVDSYGTAVPVYVFGVSGVTGVSQFVTCAAPPIDCVPLRFRAAPTPAAPSPTGGATPLALTGVQTLGSTGSGYQVSSVQYGVHGSQLWVVFQFAGGSGVPQITAGFDGPQTIYLEMQGVAPGTQVAQPAAGSLVSSISIGHVSGFSGAVYVLQLSRAAQLSPSELTGNETGAPGYLAILQ